MSMFEFRADYQEPGSNAYSILNACTLDRALSALSFASLDAQSTAYRLSVFDDTGALVRRLVRDTADSDWRDVSPVGGY